MNKFQAILLNGL